MVDRTWNLSNFTSMEGSGRDVIDTKQGPDAHVECSEGTNGHSDSFDLGCSVKNLVRIGNIPVVWDFEPDNVTVGLEVGQVLLDTSLLEALRPATKVTCSGVPISLGCPQVWALSPSLPDDEDIFIWGVLGIRVVVVIDVVYRGG